MAFLPENIGKFLNQLSAGENHRWGHMGHGGTDYPVPFDVNTIDQLKTILCIGVSCGR